MGGMLVMGHPGHMGSLGHHSAGSGSLGRCSSRCHNTNTTTTDDSGGGSSGGGVGVGGGVPGSMGSASMAVGMPGMLMDYHHSHHSGSAGSGLNGCGGGSIAGGSIGGRSSVLGTIHNGHGHHHQQYHHECIHYERLPIPVPIPTVPMGVVPPSQQMSQHQLQSEEEIEPAYATGNWNRDLFGRLKNNEDYPEGWYFPFSLLSTIYLNYLCSLVIKSN